MLKVINLSKKFKANEVFLNTNLEITDPGLYIIYGNNGSGKSTIIKIIAGMIYKTSGKLIREGSISYLPDRFSMPRLMRAKDYLNIVSDRSLSYKIDELMCDYQIPNKLIGSLSKGNLQKLGIIQALMNNSDIYLFDEPIDGLDDSSKRIFKRDIKEIILNNRIVLMALHNKTFFNDLNPTILTIKEGNICEKRKKTQAM